MEAASLTAPAGLIAARGGRLLRLRTDDQLVALFRLGSDEAFRVIHDRYRARLFAYTRQMLPGSRSDAEDALQDVLLRAYGALRADDRPVTLRAWLYRVAHNRCVDHLRRPANQPTGELFDNLSSLHDPLADIQRRDDLRRLVADVRRLPSQQRSALLMRELEGLSYAELADALGVTIPSVKSLLVRARIGLTEAREARDTACIEIRADLAAAHGKGVRGSGRARRHLRDCPGCADYRTALRGVREGLAALGGSPTGLGVIAKLLGLGGAGGGAAATAGGGGAAASGAIATGGTAKVAALVCAAVVGGGAVEASRELAQHTAPPDARGAASRQSPARAPTLKAPAGTVAGRAATPGSPRTGRRTEPGARAPSDRTRTSVSTGTVLSGAPALRVTPPATDDQPSSHGGSSADEDAQAAAAAGGMLAPEETVEPAPPTPDPAAKPQPAPLIPLLASPDADDPA